MNDIHIILDIDQTLVDSMEKYRWFMEKKNVRVPDYFLPEMAIWERVGLKEFLEYLDKNVKYISIWTNGSEDWLKFVVHKILSKYISPKRFSMLLSVKYSVTRSVNGVNALVKDINLVIKKINNPKITLKNTVLIDDNIYNCLYNKSNTLPIKKFVITKELNEPKRSESFFYIKQILEILKKTKDVRQTLTNVYSNIESYDNLFG